MPREETKLISIRIPRRVSARLAAISKRRGVSISAIIREAIEGVTEGTAQSTWEAGAHIFGRVRTSGPRDLSTNKKYLRNLGRR